LIAKHLGMLIDRSEVRDVTDRRLQGVAPEALARLLDLARATLEAPVDVTPRAAARGAARGETRKPRRPEGTTGPGKAESP